MDGYRPRQYSSAEYEREKRQAEREKANSAKIYQALDIKLDEEKVFAGPENLRSVCQILANVKNDMLYLDQKELEEKGLSFSSDSNGDIAYFDIYYDSEQKTDIAAVKAKYFLIDRLVEKYRDQPQQLEQMLHQAASVLPEETLVVLGNKFNNGLLSDNLLQISANALRGKDFTENMRQKTPEPSYHVNGYVKSNYVFPFYEHLLDKDMLNDEQAYVLKRLCGSLYKYGHYNLDKTKQQLDEKWGSHYLPRDLWLIESLKKDSPALKYHQNNNWGFDNENDKLEMITSFGDAIYYIDRQIDNPEQEQTLSFIAKDVLSRLDENNPKEVLAWLHVTAKLNSLDANEVTLKFGQWLQKQLPENQDTIFSKTIKYAVDGISEKFKTEQRLDEIYHQSEGHKEIGRVFSDNAFKPDDAYSFIYTGDYVLSYLTTSDSQKYNEDDSNDLISKGKTYQAFNLGRSDYCLVFDVEKMKKSKQSSITLCVPKEAIGTVIGKGGQNIKALGGKFRKNFKVVEMPADEAAKKRHYKFELLNDTEKKQLQNEKEELSQKIDNRASAQSLLAKKIEAFSPAPEAPNKEELWAQYAVSQITNNHGEVTNLPKYIKPILKQIYDKKLTSEAILAERKALSEPMQKADEEKARLAKEELILQQKEEREKQLAAIAQKIQNQWGDELPSMQDKNIINGTNDFINANKENLPLKLEAEDFSSLCKTLIGLRDKKQDELFAEKLRQAQETQMKIEELKKKTYVYAEPEPEPETDFLVNEETNQPVEAPREMTAAEKAAEKAKLKEAKKAAKEKAGKGQKLSGGLGGLAALIGGKGM